MVPTCHVPPDVCDGSGCGPQGFAEVLVQGDFVDRAVQVPPKAKLVSSKVARFHALRLSTSFVTPAEQHTARAKALQPRTSNACALTLARFGQRGPCNWNLAVLHTAFLAIRFASIGCDSTLLSLPVKVTPTFRASTYAAQAGTVIQLMPPRS
jgi:hypothetical protein